MIYPAYVHLGDKEHAHGVTLPDFEGCFTAADEYADLTANVQEAIELHFEGENLDIPESSDINELEATGDYEGGVWMLVDVDVSKLDSKPMRLNVSLPSHIVSKMDQFASDHHLTRSALIVRAAEEYMSHAGKG
jgi:predicted RNase H-like HicB family nuclease